MSRRPLTPADKHDRLLLDRVSPDDWTPPTPAERYNLVVIGGGTAGLVAAHGAAGLGGRVALVERGMLGGDCLVSGCVPSKALLASAAAAEAIRRGPELGISSGPPRIDGAAVLSRLRRIRAGISHDDSALRLQEAGVDVFFGSARFTGPDRVEVQAEDRAPVVLPFARACIATGARPVVPEIPGLDQVPWCTHETLFQRRSLPRRVLVIGAGPIGCELGQALRRLDCEVALVDQADRVLPAEEPEAGDLLAGALTREGVVLHLGTTVTRFEGGQTAILEDGTPLSFDLCLVAVGRRPNIDRLELAAAGVEAGQDGVSVDDFLQTTNASIYASGDVASRFRFTHAADALSRIVITNALFFGRRRASALTIPWATYTDPEVAHVGLPWDEAESDPELTCFTRELAGNDRARVEGDTVGYVRAWAKRDGTIAAATVVGAQAGELISTLSLAMQTGATLGDLSSAVFPYPTRSLALRRLGDAWNKTRLTPVAGKALDALMKLRR